ncbi:MAG: dihydroorotate dehydrogenase [Oscillospiraceae bacterium]|jgi:dihydroorotate dehydrogenase (NAD+) catalytic subunit|nr:dihydroorotate dehydrogenase [Oscillospiraceae bacterium]
MSENVHAPDLSVNLAGVTLKNPVVAVSGTFGFGREYGEYYDIGRLGAVCVKGITLLPRGGNPPPRVAETPMGMLNSVGLQNPGIDAFLSDELPFLRRFDTAVIANISGNTPEEYARMAEKLGDMVDLIEVNISCPNVKAGGMLFGTDPALAAEVTRAAKRAAGRPVLVKLTPNVTDIAHIALAVKDAGADGISLINTLGGMRIDTETRRPILRMNTGGLSGPAVLPVAIRCVYQVRGLGLPVLGMGGVSTASDAVEMMLAGAHAVGIGSAMFADPYAPMKVLQGLGEFMASHHLTRISELTGGVLPWEA